MNGRLMQRRLHLAARWLRRLFPSVRYVIFPARASWADLRAGFRRIARLERLGYDVRYMLPLVLIGNPWPKAACHSCKKQANLSAGTHRFFRTRCGLSGFVICLEGLVQGVPCKFLHANFFDELGNEVLLAIKFSVRPGFRPDYYVEERLDELHAKSKPGCWLYYTSASAEGVL